MTCSMVVNSKSGNTRMVSGAIKRALQAAGVEFIHAAALSDGADQEQVMCEAQGACAADVVLVGFWCDKGACTPSVATLAIRDIAIKKHKKSVHRMTELATLLGRL